MFLKPDKIRLLNETPDGYRSWKRKNVTLRGMKQVGEPNNVWGSFGKGLYTVPLSNKAMAKQYGDVFFVLNAKPKNPKVVQDLNQAEIVRQNLVNEFCKENGVDYSVKYFNEHTSMEKEMLKRGYDGFVIKGREMVNYRPDMEEVKYFRTERELMQYYEFLMQS
jgi:hypothetical protein